MRIAFDAFILTFQLIKCLHACMIFVKVMIYNHSLKKYNSAIIRKFYRVKRNSASLQLHLNLTSDTTVHYKYTFMKV